MNILHRTNQSLLIAAAAVMVQSALIPLQAAETALSDKEVQQGLSEQLNFDDILRARKIQVEVEEGVAVLTGEVKTLFEKDRAVALAETIRGVRAIVDQTRIAKQDRSDAAITDDVKAAVAADPAIEANDIRVSVDEGAVSLSGTADSHAERLLAARAAKSVRGVTAVNNEVEITADNDRSDKELQAEIVRRLQTDVWVTDDLIQVHVKDGRVTLAGVVASVSQKHIAEVDAFVAGVQHVDAKELKIDSNAVDDARRQRKYTAPSPGTVVDAVRDALRIDPRVDTENVQVHLEAGVIELTGHVNSLAAKRAAEQDARRTRFVARVDNQITVVAASPKQEANVKTAIEVALARDIHVSDDDIHVSVSDGSAELSGSTNSITGKQRAEKIAESVTGITSVANRLNVVDESHPPTDLEVKYEIANRLYWSSLVDDRDITVTVEDGKAALTGTVHDRSAFNFATKAAREAGAKEVDNRLLVRELHYE